MSSSWHGYTSKSVLGVIVTRVSRRRKQRQYEQLWDKERRLASAWSLGLKPWRSRLVERAYQPPPVLEQQ
ncbi:hypothetical protein TNCV_3734981 [Trichonephila clavipes]|nr:hypothetical protein TNCV_3734981 [Trichonephila clavipes]